MIRPRTMLLLVLTALAALAQTGRADEGPIIIAHRQEHPWLTLEPITGSIGINAIYEQDHSQSGGGSTTATDTLLTEELTLSTAGTIVSRNLFNWSASGTAAGQEDWFTGTGQRSGSTYGFYDAYNVSAGILEGTEFPLNAYATRSENFVTRAFAGMLRNEVTSYGASVRYRNPTLPTSFSYNSSNIVQTDLAGKTQFDIDQTNFNFATSYRPAERQNLSFSYSYGTTTQNNPGTLSNGSQQQSAALLHTWIIDPLAHYTLSQALNYSQQQGTFSQSRLRLDEQLRLRFSDTLDGGLVYGFERHDYTGSQLMTNLLTASLTHRLYESLTTTVRAGFSRSDNSFSRGGSSSLQNYFASAGTAYTKKMFQGRFGANLSLGWSESQSDAVGQVQQVIGDVQTFTDPQPIILTRTGVNASSVAVFDASGTRRFVQGVDYSVRKVHNTVQIDRIIGGNIGAGDTVRLNYDIDPLPGYTSQSVSFGAGANYTFTEGWFNGLNLYVRYYQVDQSIAPSTSGIRPDSIRDLTYGAEYRIWKLTLHAEDEIRQSTLAPYNALRLWASYVDNLDERTSVSLNATESYITVPTDHSRTSSLSIDGRLQYRIARDLNASILARWRHDSYSNASGVTGLEAQGELRWNIRQTELSLMARYTNLNAPQADTNTMVFQFGFARNF